MKKAFYFTLKTLFVLKIFKFFFFFFGHVEKRFDQKAKVDFMTSQPREQTMAIHILSISQEVKTIIQ